MKKLLNYPFRVVSIYLTFGILWIAATDQLTFRLIQDFRLIAAISVYKGWFYILASAALLYYLLAKEASRRVQAEAAQAQVEETLRASEERLARIVETIPGGITIVNRAGQITFANPAAEKILGLTRDGIAQRLYNDPAWRITAVDGSPFPTEQLPFTRVIQTGQPVYNVEHAIEHPDGRRVILSVNAAPLNNPVENSVEMVAAITDITERRRIEEALENERYLLNALLDNIPDAIYFKDCQGRFTRVSKAMAAKRGLSDTGQLLGRTDFDFFTHENAQRIYEQEQEIIRTGQPIVNSEIEEVWSDRPPTWVSVTKMPLRDPQGNVIGLFGISHDITERKRAEEALRESEERYRLLAEAAQDMIFILDRNGQVTYVNECAARQFQKTPEEVLGERQMNLFPPEIAQRQHEALKKVFDSSQPLYTEAPSAFLGKPIWLGTWLVPLKDSQGQVKGILGIARDITERKQIEESLRESQQMLRTVLDTIPVRVFWKDVNSNYLGCNLPFARDGGFQSPEELIGLNDFQISWKEQAELYRADDRYVIETGQPKLGYEEPQTTPGGRVIWLRTSKVPLYDAKGSIRGVLGTYEDITDRKMAEEKLKATLEEKEVLLREVHHRVKNNLQAIISLIDMQISRAADKATRQFLLELQEQARTMSLIYEQVYQTENLAQVAMEPYLYQIASGVLQTFGGEREVRLSLDVANLSMDISRAMPCGLIVNELITNALKHAFPPSYSGKPAIRVTLKAAKNKITLTVSDNGVGLPAGQDWQKSPSLGMRLVHLWAKHQLGGEIKVNTAHGTTYIIVFQALRE